MNQGVVVSHLGVAVAVEDNNLALSSIRIPRNSGYVVGDQVEWHNEIIKKLPRKNELARQLDNQKQQVIAANIDFIGIVCACLPRTASQLIDHIFVAAQLQSIGVFLVINKMDMPQSDAFLEQMQAEYTKVCPIFPVSAKQQLGLKQLELALSGYGRSILVGPSGVGKSSLINALLPSATLRTADLVDGSRHGTHVTTTATLHHLPKGGELIDTPGVRHFVPPSVKPSDAASFFPGFAQFLKKPCHFRNCLHENEPGCSIKQAHASGLLPGDRYQNYLELLKNLK